MTILHFLGYDEDRGGVLTAIRAVSRHGGSHVLVVNAGFAQRRRPELPLRMGPAVAAETISARELARTFRAAVALLPAATGGDVVVHGQSRAGMLVGLWLYGLGVRGVVVSPHCYGRRRWLYRWASWWMGGRWVWLSPQMKRYYGAGTGGWTQCIPEPAPPRVAVRNGNHRDRSRPIVLAGLGNIVPWKGWHLVLHALGRLSAAERAGFRFVHFGDADASAESQAYFAQLRADTSALGLTPQVEWRGWSPDASQILREADIAVVPSVNEPMALAGLEALAAGVPLIIADSGGLNDVVTPGRNALVFATGSAESLAQCLRAVLRTDFLVGAAVRADDFARVDAGRVAEQWIGRYRAAGAAGDERIV